MSLFVEYNGYQEKVHGLNDNTIVKMRRFNPSAMFKRFKTWMIGRDLEEFFTDTQTMHTWTEFSGDLQISMYIVHSLYANEYWRNNDFANLLVTKENFDKLFPADRQVHFTFKVKIPNSSRYLEIAHHFCKVTSVKSAKDALLSVLP